MQKTECYLWLKINLTQWIKIYLWIIHNTHNNIYCVFCLFGGIVRLYNVMYSFYWEKITTIDISSGYVTCLFLWSKQIFESHGQKDANTSIIPTAYDGQIDNLCYNDVDMSNVLERHWKRSLSLVMVIFPLYYVFCRSAIWIGILETKRPIMTGHFRSTDKPNDCHVTF